MANMPTSDQIHAFLAGALEGNSQLCFAVGCAVNSATAQIFYFPTQFPQSASPRNMFGLPLAPGDTTQWQLGSVTKTFTAVAYARQMPGQGTTVASQYIKSVSPTDNTPVPILDVMTLDSLVNYQSGLPIDDITSANDTVNPPVPYSGTAMLYYLASSAPPLIRNRGGGTASGGGYGFSYSNLAFSIMGSVLKADAKTNLMGVYRKQLFNDLHMSCVLFKRMDLLKSPQGYEYSSEAYSYTNARRVNPGNPLFPANNPGGGLVSTAPDLMIWLKFNMGWLLYPPMVPTDLNKAGYLTQCYSPQVTTGPNYTGAFMGLGWFTSIGASPRVMKDGGLPGASSFITFQPWGGPGYPPSQCGVFVLCNASGLRYIDPDDSTKTYDFVQYLSNKLMDIMLGIA